MFDVLEMIFIVGAFESGDFPHQLFGLGQAAVIMVDYGSEGLASNPICLYY